jgi:hypothetical protein
MIDAILLNEPSPKAGTLFPAYIKFHRTHSEPFLKSKSKMRQVLESQGDMLLAGLQYTSKLPRASSLFKVSNPGHKSLS